MIKIVNDAKRIQEIIIFVFTNCKNINLIKIRDAQKYIFTTACR